MRKELILVLLGIICTSFLSTFLSGYVQIRSDKVLLDTVVGVVGAGNFSYWQLGHTGPLLVELTSLTGDADLYVSENIRPGYEIDKNNFSSATCGEDLISIPVDFPRPLGIGVFGYWSHDQSEYSIQVFLDAAAAGEHNVFEAHSGEMAGSGMKGQTENSFLLMTKDVSKFSKRKMLKDGDFKHSQDKSTARKHDDENKPRFLKLLSVLNMIFEMFVM